MRLELMRFGSSEKGFPVRVLGTPWERLRGLLGRGNVALPVVLEPCSSVHTLGMGYALDLVFLGSDGVVLASERGVPPGKVRWKHGSMAVLERPASKEPWPEVGERVARRPLGG